jgi:hypothetical protein
MDPAITPGAGQPVANAATVVAREVPALDALVELPAGRYTLGEPGEERVVELDRVLIGRYRGRAAGS